MKKIAVFIVIIITGISFNCTRPPVCKGAAKPDCICTMQYDPVCGCDGKTYGNVCVAGCAGVTSWVKGECK